NILFCGQNPRAIQVIALLTALNSKDKGILLQVSTGEGKSTITSMLSAIFALQGRKVDIITSSSILAERDAEERAGFFNLLGIKVGHNCYKNSQAEIKKFKECY